ncbi:MAG: carbohydrate ABC transporter permease [Blautia sp.]
MRIKKNSSDRQIGWHFLMALLVLVAIVPILFAFVSSFKSMQELYNGSFFPTKISLENYQEIADALPILKITLNTLVVAVTVTAFKVITSTLAAYAFVFFDFKGKNILYFFLISTIFIPFTVTMIPNYLTVSNLKLVDSIWGVALPQLADASGIFLIRQAMRTVPKPLIEISKLDDVSELKILKDIIIPVCRPAIISTGIIFFINAWNEYVWPTLILRSKENYTLSLAMQVFTDSEGGIEYTVTLAMAVITMILPVVLYLIFQRYIMSTFASSGIKG